MSEVNNNILLRLEQKEDYSDVENITREAFWNIYQPGCEEHFLVHKIRGTKQFVSELDFVATIDDVIVGNIVYVETSIIDSNDDRHKTLTFGPVSVLPNYQNMGVGIKLITHTISLSKDMGYRAIVIFGDPEYYSRFGFVPSKEFGITTVEGKFPAAMLVLELHKGALKEIKGKYDGGDVYNIDSNSSDFDKFDKQFPSKDKKHTASQDKFQEMVSKFL